MKSKGMLFILDALFAVMLLFSALALFSLLFSTQNINTQLSYFIIHFQAEDAIDVLSKLRISDARAEPVVRELFDEGFLSDEDLNKTILDVVGLLWAADNPSYTEAAGELVGEMFNHSFSPSLEWSLQAKSEAVQTTIYNSSVLENISIAGASARIASGYALGEPTKGYLARIFLSSIGGVQKSSYYYFGGFIGEGNVSIFFRGLPIDANFSSLYLELNAGDNFTLFVNNASCGQYNASGGLGVDSWSVTGSCLNNFLPGADNNVTLSFIGSNISRQFIGGGFFKLSYTTSQLSPQLNDTMRYYFPGINGFFYVYDSFYVPGNITQINTHVEFESNYTTFFRVGGNEVFNVSGSQSRQLIDNYSFELENTLDFQGLSEKTIPIRLGVQTAGQGVAIGEADVILITDLSGSMNWQLGSNDYTGVERTCSNPQLYENTTQRLSLAKCLDKDFVEIILNTSGNRVGLVGFSTSAYTFTSLTNDSNYLNSVIEGYDAYSGTCVCCAINRAYEILNSQSSPSRQKFIVVMSDGIAGYKCSTGGGWSIVSSPTSNDLYGTSFASESLGFAVGYNGRIIRWNGVSWQNIYSPTSRTLYSIAFADADHAFAVGSNGAIIRWNGGDWYSVSSPVGNQLLGVGFENADHGFAVGIGGVIIEWKNNSWKKIYSPTTHALYSVAFSRPGKAFAVGANGVIIRWNGTNWSQISSPTPRTLRSVAFYNETLGFAVGYSGTILQWNGISWSIVSSPTGYSLYGVDFMNSTHAFAVGQSGRIIEWGGSSWSILSSPTSYYLYAVEAISDSLAFAVSQSGRIVRYSPPGCEGTETSGYYSCGGNPSDCNNPDCACAADNAVYSSQRAFTQLNATVYSVGFGPVSSCFLANNTLYRIAQAGNGSYYSSSNASELAEIYSGIAGEIVEVTIIRQAAEIFGGLQTILYPSSYIEFVFESSIPERGYSEIVLPFESQTFSSCEDATFIPQNFTIEEARITSYSGDYWTDNVSIKNANTSGQWLRLFNLENFGWNYFILGDPFNVCFDSTALAGGGLNYFHVSTGQNPFERNPNCSNSNKLIYSARISASVPYDKVFPEIRGGNYTVFYDLNADSIPDGNTSVAIGANLPNFDPTPKTIDQLDIANNAYDDALLRFLTRLNYYSQPGDIGMPGSQTNPIDVKLGAEVYSEYASSPEIPFMWGPAEIKISIWR